MTVLRFDSVSKRYRIRSGPESVDARAKGRFRRSKTHSSDFWALKNVSFEVKAGESLGIIGHNGAGKSTVLKLLSNITTPNKGQITINGRISALLEVGSGFHPELTGRENVYLSGSILGMRRAEITNKLESIIDFAGVRAFIDIPVKRFSSGMYVRLGFSIAAHLDPDILLLDEVLAVGDYAFQEKCKQRIADMHRQGTTMVFISHDLNAVRSVCQRAVLLQRGEAIAEGTPEEVIRRYTETTAFHQTPQINDERRVAEVTGVFFYDSRGNRTNGFQTGDPVSVRINYFVHRRIPRGSVSLYFLLSDRSVAAQWSTSVSGQPLDMREGPGSVEFTCDELGLQPGVYQIDTTIEKCGTSEEYEWQHACATIHVDTGKIVRGAFYMPHSWRQNNSNLAVSEYAIHS